MIRIFLSFVVTMRMIKVRWCFNLIIFVVVISFYMAHLREGTSRIPRYVYCSFWERMERCGLQLMFRGF